MVNGPGIPFQNDTLFQSVANALASGSNTVTLSGLTPTISKGLIRMKIYGAATSPSMTMLQATLSDGLEFVTVYYNWPGTALTLATAAGGTSVATDGAMTSGTKVLTSASAKFTSAMVGQNIYIPSAGGTSGAIALLTTVASFQSAGTITLAAAATSTVTGATITLVESYYTAGSATAPAGFDVVVPFEVDINVTRLDVTEVGVGSAIMDLEISGTT